MTLITDYTSLQSAVAEWLHRSDLTSQIPVFIQLAEARMSSDIKARPMESRTTLTCTGSNAYVTLPSDMTEMRRLYVTGDPIQKLDYLTPDQLSQKYASSYTGKPLAFTVIGSELQLAPTPDAAYTMELTYMKRIPSLASGTNWLITSFPNAYLYATLLEAQPWMLNDPRIPTIASLYQQAIDGINSIDWYSGSTMKMSSDTAFRG